MHTRFSTRGHQRVAYDVDGPDGAVTVVLLHDLLGQRSSLAPIRAQVVTGVRTVAVDLRGHGASATISGASVDLRDLALDVASVLQQEQVASAVLVGHGLGAAVARLLAAESQPLVTAVVAIEPSVTGLDGQPLAETDRRAADLAYKGLVDAALAAYLTPRLGPTWRDDLPRPTVAALRRHAPALATLISALAATKTPPDAGDSSRPIIRIASEAGRLDLPPSTIAGVVDAAVSLLGPVQNEEGARVFP